jgi:hypothetical protein
MRGAVLLDPWTDWECPQCGLEQRTRPVPPNATRMHTCPRLHDLTVPLTRAGSDCTIVAHEREDYLGKEEQRRGDDGRPYMNAVTEYADGHTDLAVFSPVARGYL